MGLVNRKMLFLQKDKITLENFEKMHFEPISNNDYWVYKSLENQTKFLKENPGNLENSPSYKLYQSQNSNTISEIFGEPNFPKYKNHIYDVWVVRYKNTRFLIRQSSEGTVYDIHVPEKNGKLNTNIHNDTDLGKEIEQIMFYLLKQYQ